MIQYVTTNIVSAWPEARQDRPGYGIKHADGYLSWCPKEPFEASSIALGNIDDLEPHQQRLIAELRQLHQRIADLELFLGSGKAEKIAGFSEVGRMNMQLHAMELYVALLHQRAGKFLDHTDD
jgi:hypothetical protein